MKAYLEIEMPRCCNKCPLFVYEGIGICACRALPAIEDDEILKPWKNRRKGCPLIPIPPHGNLIDRDALLDTATIHWSQTTNESCFPIDEIEYAPTVIPADEMI